MNDSRIGRELEVANSMLTEIRPRLPKMSVTDLIGSLIVIPRGATLGISGVPYYVYRDGNEMILSEIETRPKHELAVLPGLADDKVEVWDGDNGSLHSLAFIIHDRILHYQ